MTIANLSASVSVKVTFKLPDGAETTQQFDPNNTPVARIGLPDNGDVEPPPSTPGLFSYSGRHDQGLLPQPREGGAYSQLIGCVQASKEFSDTHLTEVMKKEKSRKQEPGGGNGQVLKKSKVDESR